MVGHQHVGMQPAALARQRLSQPVEVGEPVLVIKKAGRPVVTALHDVQRQVVDMDACAAGHAGSLAEIEPGSLFPTIAPYAGYLRVNGLKSVARS